MDLNGAGLSLFQGNELSNFDNLAQREEEEEAIEEQRRRDLELKSMLENAFDDVSIDNDEESVCNGSPNNSTTNHSIFHNYSNLEFNGFKANVSNGLQSDLKNDDESNHIENFNGLHKQKPSKSNTVKRVDFNHDSQNYSNQCRKKIQNGNLHDIVDASGGGDTVLSLHLNHCIQRSPLDEFCNGVHSSSTDSIKKTQFSNEAYDSSDQLKILYDVRVREVHRLTEMIDSLKKEHEIAIKKLKQQVAIAQAEIERSNISQSQLETLLITKKQELEKLEKHIVDLEKTNNNLESCKNELASQLETNKLIINDLERKIVVLEKGNRNSFEAVQYESNIKALIEKHKFELMNANAEQERITRLNEELVKENAELKHRVNQISQASDDNLARKSEIISRLSKQVDDAQKQCESLMKSSAAEENIRLQMTLKIVNEEKSLLLSKLEALEKENTRQEEELKQYESLSKISTFGSLSDGKDFDVTDVSGTLGTELFRALNGQKAKRQEIKNLQGQVDEKNEKIKVLTESENILKLEVNKLKEEVYKHIEKIKNQEKSIVEKETENTRLQECIKKLKEEFEEKRNDVRSTTAELENEIESLKNSVASLEKEKTEAMSNYSEEYMRFHNEGLKRVREEAEKFFQLEILKKDLENENLKKEIEEIKNLYVEVFNSKEALLKELEKEKNHPTWPNSSGNSNNVVDVDEVKRLQKELEKSRNRILELDQTLKQQYEQEVEILNLDINRLNLQVEKVKKEKDREIAEKDKICLENELLKSEIEHVTSEKNLLFLNLDKLQKEMEEVRRNLQIVKEGNKNELKELKENYDTELQNLTDKYEIIIKKLKKEVELTLAKTVRYETKYTSPKKNRTRNVESQCSPTLVENKSISPRPKTFTKEMGTSPVFKSNWKTGREGSVRNISVLTDPEVNRISKKEIVEIMEKLGAHHENEMRALESKYRIELGKLDKKFQIEVDKAKELIREELEKAHVLEMERLRDKHKIEMENRIEQEKKEAVAELITEWACEVQGLKASYAEAQTEMERMKMKYKAAKSVALQYKTYFRSKAEYMKEEWKKIEGGYEQALKELEKNVHILVDVKEDEVKAKVDSITKIYEQKISKMKEKLSKCEDRLKAKKLIESRKKSSKSSLDEFELKSDLEKLKLPEGNLFLSSSRKEKKPKDEIKLEF